MCLLALVCHINFCTVYSLLERCSMQVKLQLMLLPIVQPSRYQKNMFRYIEGYVQKVNPQKAPQVCKWSCREQKGEGRAACELQLLAPGPKHAHLHHTCLSRRWWAHCWMRRLTMASSTISSCQVGGAEMILCVEGMKRAMQQAVGQFGLATCIVREAMEPWSPTKSWPPLPLQCGR